MLEAILISPELYAGPPMVKPPVVQLATMLRALGRGIDTEAWVWLCEEAGQRLFWPPNVSGWDDNRWLDTSRMRARWNMVTYALDEISVDAWDDHYSTTETADEALDAGASPPGARRHCAPNTATSCSTSPSAARNSSSPTGRKAPTGRCARTPCCS